MDKHEGENHANQLNPTHKQEAVYRANQLNPNNPIFGGGHEVGSKGNQEKAGVDSKDNQQKPKSEQTNPKK